MSDGSDHKPILEADCTICGRWPERSRSALREMLDTLPLHEEPICDACLMAWARAVWLVYRWRGRRRNRTL